MESEEMTMQEYIQYLQEQGLIDGMLKQSLLKHLRDHDSEVSKRAIDTYRSYDVEYAGGRVLYYKSQINNIHSYAFKSAEEVELYDAICKITKDEQLSIKIFAIVCKLAGVKTDWGI